MASPVNISKFSPLDQTQLLSCSDDYTVKLWDIPSQKSIITFNEHTDYVRSGHVMPHNPSLLLTGSYDSTMRLFDVRSGKSEMVLQCSSSYTKGDSSSSVYDVLPFPSGTMALSASGSAGIIKLWDLVAGGKCVRAMSNHQKSVTCLAFDSNAGRVLSGGLDHMVKVYDVNTWKVVHTMRYPAPVLCLGVSVSLPTSFSLVSRMTDTTFFF